MPDTRQYRQVAELHMQGITDGFLSSLGPKFLALLYQAIDEATGSTLILETREGRVVGFVAGGKGMGPIYRRMLRRFPHLVLALAPQLLKPAKLRGVIEIVLNGGGKEHRDASKELPKEELFSIVVAPEVRGQGIADTLYRKLSRQFADNGATRFRIMVGKNLGPAHSFYRRMGAEARFTGSFHKGARSVVYVQNVDMSSLARHFL